MPRSRIDGVGLVAAVVAAGVGFGLLAGPFAWLGGVCGLLLLLTLLAYDAEGYRTVFESLAFSAVTALTIALAAAVPLRIIAVSEGHPAAFEAPLTSEWLPLLWLGATVILWPIDRARMSGRIQYGGEPTLNPVGRAKPRGIADDYRSVTSEPARTPAPAPYPPAPAAVPTPQSFAPPGAALAADPLPSIPVPASDPIQTVMPPAPIPTQAVIPRGPEVTIYVTLVGEGLNVLRGVQAEHLGRDFYKIIEPMPEGETWQYGPGQVVRCKKKNLSGGKALVAIEEAPRAQ